MSQAVKTALIALYGLSRVSLAFDYEGTVALDWYRQRYYALSVDVDDPEAFAPIERAFGIERLALVHKMPDFQTEEL